MKNRVYSILIFSYLCMSFFITSAFCLEAGRLELGKGTGNYDLKNYYSYYIDKTGSVQFEDIISDEYKKRFKPSMGKPVNFGVVPDHECWLRIKIYNPSEKAIETVVELGTSTINSATLYYPEKDGEYKSKTTGDLHKISERDYFHRHLNFALNLEPKKETVLYLLLKTEAILETSIQLHTRKAFESKLPVEYLLLGFFYSAFFVAIFYNLFIYFSLRDINYLLYVLYAASFLGLWAYLDGLGQLFLWPESPWQQVWGTRIANTVTCFFMVMFADSFFNCKKTAPRIHKIFMSIALLCIINTFFVSILPLVDYKVPVRLAWLFSIPTIIFTAALFLKRGFKRARYFLTAWLFVLAGASVFLIDMYLGLLPNSFFTRYSWRIASVFEIIMLSLALADRINELNHQKEEAKNHALEIEKQLKQDLEKQVDIRTKELQKALDEVKQLSGLLPICSSCKKIRDDNGNWNHIESYIQKHSDAKFSHGMCPDCLERAYGDEKWYRNMIKDKNK
ncbi:MAG: hypothetical protein H6680_10975 [Desulfobacteraceae bacterium]|nr:hypothetical protein [Desulfobacteraceae bacterium]